MSKKYSKSRRTRRSRKQRQTKRVKGGGCGCAGSVSGGIPGGTPGAAELSKLTPALYRGGFSAPSNIQNLPIRTFYPLADYKDDVQRMQMTTRLTGGSRSRKSRKMKGGIGIPFSFIQGLNDRMMPFASDPISTTGNTSGSMVSNNLYTANPSATYNPMAMKYNGPNLV